MLCVGLIIITRIIIIKKTIIIIIMKWEIPRRQKKLKIPSYARF
jgi:hypothetical protein